MPEDCRHPGAAAPVASVLRPNRACLSAAYLNPGMSLRLRLTPQCTFAFARLSKYDYARLPNGSYSDKRANLLLLARLGHIVADFHLHRMAGPHVVGIVQLQAHMLRLGPEV